MTSETNSTRPPSLGGEWCKQQAAENTKALSRDLPGFDSRTDTIYWPDGIEETLVQYQKRKHKFEYIRSLQDALEKLKVLYQNPGCLTKEEYYAAKGDIQEVFFFWEESLFIEFEDK
jgi:hypothetical protein